MTSDSIKRRRFGRFFCTSEFMENVIGRQIPVFENIYPLKIEFYPDRDMYHFTAISERFDPVKIGDRAPEYKARVKRRSDGSWDIKWSKTEVEDEDTT